ncbi:MAG: 4-hydroxy-tetrahydrodipicolinate reductase [Pirellulales bacterium]
MSTPIAIHGAAGRMGKRLIALASNEPQLQVVAALESASHPALGQDAGVIAGIGDMGILLTSLLPVDVGVVIDFSIPEAAMNLLGQCVETGTSLVLATTGFSLEQQETIRRATERIPIVWAPSMSAAVNLTMKLTEVAAQALQNLPSGVDVEIIERHHRFKEDAPSGTALRFGQIVADQMGQKKQTHGREGRPGQRSRDEIGYHAIRTGDNPGEHTIVFGMLGETIELRVAATGRDCYAQGALLAAQWLAKKPTGLYDMNDVLGL